MPNPKLAIGIPHYGRQDAKWWVPLTATAVMLAKENIEFVGIIAQGVSTVDTNRNLIADRFLNGTNAEWLWWIDTDNPPQPGMATRLLGVGKTLVSGLYYSNWDDTKPIAYVRAETGAYNRMDDISVWERGEILPRDAAGAGCLMTHRSVYDDIRSNYTMVQMPGGTVTVVHHDDIHGEIPEKFKKHPYAGQIRKGMYYLPVMVPTLEKLIFPYFCCMYGRSEDMWFFELAKRVGHQLYVDTGVEVDHLKLKALTGHEHRWQKGRVPCDCEYTAYEGIGTGRKPET